MEMIGTFNEAAKEPERPEAARRNRAMETYCDCGKLVAVERNGMTARHNDQATNIICDGMWVCPDCKREWAGYNRPNECECGRKPAASVFA